MHNKNSFAPSDENQSLRVFFTSWALFVAAAAIEFGAGGLGFRVKVWGNRVRFDGLEYMDLICAS